MQKPPASEQSTHTKMSRWFKARKKPIIVEVREVEPKFTFAGSTELISKPKKGEYVETREGKLIAIAGEDYIIKGVEGELYPISKEIFHKTYEKC